MGPHVMLVLSSQAFFLRALQYPADGSITNAIFGNFSTASLDIANTELLEAFVMCSELNGGLKHTALPICRPRWDIRLFRGTIELTASHMSAIIFILRQIATY